MSSFVQWNVKTCDVSKGDADIDGLVLCVYRLYIDTSESVTVRHNCEFTMPCRPPFIIIYTKVMLPFFEVFLLFFWLYVYYTFSVALLHFETDPKKTNVDSVLTKVTEMNNRTLPTTTDALDIDLFPETDQLLCCSEV